MTTDRKKIAVFGVKTVPYTGGIENVVENTMPYISGCDVVVYVRKKYFNNEKLKNVKIICLPHLHGKTFEAVSHTLLSVLHALFIEKADVFFFHAIVLGLFTPIPKIFGKKVILQTHGLDFKREKWGLTSKILIHFSTYLAAKIPHRTICVAETDCRYLLNKYKNNFTIVNNGVHIPTYEHEDGLLKRYKIVSKQYILFMARLVPEKGVHLLIEAYKKIDAAGNNKNIKLVIAGDTNYYDNYYYSIKKNADDNIIFTGFVNGDAKYTLLENALCFVQPSSIEGMSTGVLEAMQMGIVPVVSDIEENLNVVKNFGYSFKSGSVEDLTRILLSAIDNTNNKQRLQMIEYTKNNYSWKKTILELNKILNEL